MRFTVLRSKAASTSKLYAFNTSMGNSKFNVSDASRLFFPDFLRAQNKVQVIEGKIIKKLSQGKQKPLRVSRRFELSRGRVIDGKQMQ